MASFLDKFKTVGKFTALVAVILFFLTTATVQGRAAAKAVLFIPQIIPDLGVSPLSYFSQQPVRESIQFPTRNGGHGLADLYLPAGNHKHPAVVFFMGVVPPDRDEARVVALGEGLARTGMIVLIPWLRTQNENRIITSDISDLVDAFTYLESHPRTKKDQIGMGGICTGAAMAVVAAENRLINQRVSFINSFAGYYDAFDLIGSVVSSTAFYADSTRIWKPDTFTKRISTAHLIDGTYPKDRLILDKVTTKGHWESKDYGSLSDSGKAVLNLISGPNLPEAMSSLRSLNPNTIEFLSQISPSSNISNLRADVFLMHDKHDKMIPSEESRRFAQAAKKNGNKVHLTEFSSFQNIVQVHKNDSEKLNSVGYIKQLWKLFLHMYYIMRLAS